MSRYSKKAPKPVPGYKCPRCNTGRIERGRKNGHCTNNKCRFVGHIASFIAGTHSTPASVN